MPKFYSVRRKVSGYKVPVGMYSGEGGLRYCDSYATVPERHPGPTEDSGLSWGSSSEVFGVCSDSLYFGFGCLTQLKAWLYNEEWRKFLNSSGYVVMVWNLPDELHGYPCMQVGNAQAVATYEALTTHEPQYLSLLDLECMDLDF